MFNKYCSCIAVGGDNDGGGGAAESSLKESNNESGGSGGSGGSDGNGGNGGNGGNIDDTDESDEDVQANGEDQSIVHYLSRRDFMVVLVAVCCVNVSKKTKQAYNPKKIDFEMNQMFKKNLLQHLLGAKFRTFASPYFTADGWRNERYTKKNIETILLPRLLKLRKLFNRGILIEVETQGTPEATKQNSRGHIAPIVTTMNVKQWNILLSDKYLNAFTASFGAVKGEQCFRSALPLTMDEQASPGLSFYCFVEALVRVIDTDPKNNRLSEQINQKIEEWNL